MLSSRALAPLVPVIAAIAAYSNSFGNSFALDDAHSIEGNPWVRSLAHVPRYFVDPSTFSTLVSNVDYRPVLQTTYALNYAISGYAPWSWHLVNLSIHCVTAVAVFLLGRRLVGSDAVAPEAGLSPRAGDAAALAASVLFAVHPITSGCVNYISARSSSLVAALVLPALVLYLRALAPGATGRGWPSRLIALGLYVLALLTKIEAVSLLAVLVLAELLLVPEKRARPIARRLFDAGTLLRLAPFALVTIAAVVLWSELTGIGDAAARAGRALTSRDYFLTELRAWWYYIGQLAAPVDLVADDPTYPVSRSLADPRVLLAAAGWAIVLLGALVAARSAPVPVFLILTFFVWLAPHSSVLPLAEPVNEHRPYLASTSVFLLAAIAGTTVLARTLRRPIPALAAIVVALAIPLAMLTHARNLVWRDALSLWEDTARKAPESPRAQMNYGLALMVDGRLVDAEGRFREAARLGPYYALARTNLAIVLDALGRTDEAREQHDDAVRLGGAGSAPLYWRGRFRASHGEYGGAIDDLQIAARQASSPFKEWAALSEVLAAVGRDADASDYATRGMAVDGAGFASERAAFRSAALGGASAIAVMNYGVALMRASRFDAAEAAFLRARAIEPESDLVQTNLGILRSAQGRDDDARAAHDAAVRLAPFSSSPVYWRGRFLAERGDLDAALLDFAVATQRAPSSVRELAALAECLARLERDVEAEEIVERGLAVDSEAFGQARTEVSAGVFDRRAPARIPVSR